MVKEYLDLTSYLAKMNCLDPTIPKFAGITKVRISFLSLGAFCHSNTLQHVYMELLEKT